MFISAACTAVLLAAGCRGATIDASSPQSMLESIEHVRSQLNPVEQTAFDTALNDLEDLLFKRPDAVTRATVGQYRPDALLRKILHGKTAREVVVMVEDYQSRDH